jgi:hypothetical protein
MLGTVPFWNQTNTTKARVHLHKTLAMVAWQRLRKAPVRGYNFDLGTVFASNLEARKGHARAWVALERRPVDVETGAAGWVGLRYSERSDQRDVRRSLLGVVGTPTKMRYGLERALRAERGHGGTTTRSGVVYIRESLAGNHRTNIYHM